uniref:Uncharacterized protein n=1 Tax=Anguilla anguilla TaxID=7936 RepID=A0A0E9W5P8_ANGAN
MTFSFCFSVPFGSYCVCASADIFKTLSFTPNRQPRPERLSVFIVTFESVARGG